MRLGKLHPLRVTLKAADGESEAVRVQSLSGGFDPPIVVQVIAPGAVVTPSHQIIPVSGGEGTFMVQPLSTGKLKGAKVEFLSQGRKISEVALPMRANRGRLGKFLLWLGILLPFIINLFPKLTFIEYKAGSRPGGIDPDIVDTGRIRELSTPNLGSGGGGGGSRPSKNGQDKTKGNSKTSTPPKKEQAEPEKKDSTPAKDAPPAKVPDLRASPAGKKASLEFQAHLLSSLVALQPPENSKIQEATKDDPSKIRVPGDPSVNATDDKRFTTATKPGQGAAAGGVTHHNEAAISAWVRSKLVQNGYQTKQLPRDPEADSGFFNFPRTFEITDDSKADWNTPRFTALALYYCEPALRFMYRIFIEFPKNWPFGDLIYALVILTLGAFILLFTGPNRAKVKGPVMDIRLAAS